MSNRKSTSLVELVETHNIALSIKRLYETPGASVNRALYHAICMSFGISDYDTRKAIREALRLP